MYHSCVAREATQRALEHIDLKEMWTIDHRGKASPIKIDTSVLIKFGTRMANFFPQSGSIGNHMLLHRNENVWRCKGTTCPLLVKTIPSAFETGN